MTTRPTFLTRRRTLAAAATSFIGCAALPCDAIAAEPHGTALRIGMAAPNTTMDPHLQSNAPNNAVASHIFDALVTNDEQSRSAPGLAVSWQAIDDTHWVFHLRPGVRFTDGTPFTAADAVASIRRATDLPSTASFRGRNVLLGEASAIAFHDLAILPLHHEMSVWGARKDMTYATRADQYTLATGIGRQA